MSSLQAVEDDEIVTNSWRASRSDMLMLLSRVSYRSVLALYLFAQTPVPAGIGEEEELSGISGSVCMHVALMHIQKLRQRCDPVKKAQANVTQAFLDLESRAYWAAVIWDTSDSLSSDMRTSLTSGLNGACSEPAWRLARAFLVGSFTPSTERWLTNGFDINDENASRIIGAASVSQVLMWKNVTSLKEALREGVDEGTVLWVWNSLQDTVSIFRNSIRPLLGLCERRIQFLGQAVRLCWFEVTLRYCVGVMVLLDALEVAKRSDLLEQLLEVRDEVEHESFAVLKFGMDNVYRIPTQGHLDTEVASLIPREPMEIPFVTLYAFPRHVVTLVQLVCRGIVQKRHEEKLDRNVFAHLASMLVDSLALLPRNLKEIGSARRGLEAMVEGA
ncbi:uncharacterized protein N0V89_001729 [Didymosphaeria variabile]|uniref:Uncharacterized protein n=1 Tax=Didymosphaeria variabile TaxID=1932322 RepID=A0A9W8XRB9_9PLEO|nr:uncharacterized protein N0V89_001729 [Didymosphaeria variabile]KAJ4357154.1 hypothetical protein N0V89_001729 [Didymosphaeria variabile]